MRLEYSCFLFCVVSVFICESQMTNYKRGSVRDLHNKLRQSVSFGYVKDARNKRQPTAANMHKLKYDFKLEKSAQRWANTCKFKHDTNNEKYGENLAMSTTKDVKKMVQSWFDEIKHGVIASYDRYNSKYTSRMGHYTQLVWGKSARIGCGYKDCRQYNKKYKKMLNMGYLVCRYFKRGNVIGQAIYKRGYACTKCNDFQFDKCDKRSKMCDV